MLRENDNRVAMRRARRRQSCCGTRGAAMTAGDSDRVQIKPGYARFTLASRVMLRTRVKGRHTRWTRLCAATTPPPRDAQLPDT